MDVLLSTEIDLYVNDMHPFSVEKIGTRQWFEWHYRLQKLAQQAVINASNCKEESVKDTLTAGNKINVLIQEAIVISVWKHKILPIIMQSLTSDSSCSFLAYAVLFHEATCVALLESVLFHTEAWETLNDYAVDLIDYCYANVTKLCVVATKNDEEEEFRRQERSLQFDVGIRSISLLRYACENLDNLSMSVTTQIYKTHDVLPLLVQLVFTAPWSEGNKVYTENQWTNSRTEKASSSEVQTWLAVRSLLLNPNYFAHCADVSNRRTIATKLIPLLNDVLLDQVSPLCELKQLLNRLVVARADERGARKTPIVVVVEILPGIRTALIAKYRKKWNEIAAMHATRLFEKSDTERRQLAEEINKAYNAEMFETTFLDNERKECAACFGNRASRRCSKCKNVWYCNRMCQVEHWSQHKNDCR